MPNGPKSALLLAAVQLVSTGHEGFTSIVEARELFEGSSEVITAGGILHQAAQFAAASNQRVCSLWLALDRAAQDDPEVGRAYQELIVRMRRDSRSLIIDPLRAMGALRTDLTPDELGDVFWSATLPDHYHRLVEQAGWAVGRYAVWLEQSLRELLLANDDDRPAVSD